MTREAFVSKNFHEMFGIVAEAWLAKHEDGATFSKDIRVKQARIAEMLGELYDQLIPKSPAPNQPPKGPK